MNQPCLLLGRKLIGLSGRDEFIIGRVKECDLTLADDRVSRRHARIRHTGGRFFIRDLDSVNGTFVNGDRLTDSTALVPGDEIVIIPHKMLFVLAATEDGSAIGPQTTATGRQRSHFSGLLGALRLADLIQLLNSTFQSGMLTIHDAKKNEGRMSMIQGEIDQAWFEGKTADDAVYAMLSLKEGDFEFAPGTPNRENGISRSTMSLLLEGCRLIDENVAKTQSIKI